MPISKPMPSPVIYNLDDLCLRLQDGWQLVACEDSKMIYVLLQSPRIPSTESGLEIIQHSLIKDYDNCVSELEKIFKKKVGKTKPISAEISNAIVCAGINAGMKLEELANYIGVTPFEPDRRINEHQTYYR